MNVAERFVAGSTIFGDSLGHGQREGSTARKGDAVEEGKIVEFCSNHEFDVGALSLAASVRRRAEMDEMVSGVRKRRRFENLRARMEILGQFEILMNPRRVLCCAGGEQAHGNQGNKTESGAGPSLLTTRLHERILHGERIGRPTPRLESSRRRSQ